MEAAVAVAVAAEAKCEHEDTCREWRCLMRGGCEEWEQLEVDLQDALDVWRSVSSAPTDGQP